MPTLNDKHFWFGLFISFSVLYFLSVSAIGLVEADMFRLIPHIGAWAVSAPGVLMVLLIVIYIIFGTKYASRTGKSQSWKAEFRAWRNYAEYAVNFWSFVVITGLYFALLASFLITFVCIYGFNPNPAPQDTTANTIGNFNTSGLEDDRWLATSVYTMVFGLISATISIKYGLINYIAVSASGSD